MKRSVNFRNFLTVFFKYKTAIIMVWAAAIVAIIIGNQVVKPTYESESSLMVNFGREYLYTPEVGKQLPYNYYDRSGLINSEIEILSSQDLIETVIATIGLDKLYPSNPSSFTSSEFFKRIKSFLKTLKNIISSKEKTYAGRDLKLEKAIEEYNKHLTILGSKESNVIRVIFQHNDPEMAALVVNLHVDQYQKKHLDMFRDKRVTSFLEDKVGNYKHNLKESEKQLEQYKKQHRALTLDLQEEILVRQRGQFDSLLKNNVIEEKSVASQLNSLEKQLAGMSESAALFSETVEQDRVIDNAKAKLLSLKLEEDELRNIYQENSSQIKNIRKRVSLVEEFLENQKLDKQATVRVGKNTTYQDIEHEIAVTRARLEALRSKSKSIAEELQVIDDNLNRYQSAEQMLRSIVREYKINEDNYLAYVAKLEEARINNEMDNQVMTNIRVVHNAVPAPKPIKPKKGLNLLVGFIMGGVAGIGMAFYRNFINQGINAPEEIERLLGCQVFATISYKRT